MQNQLRVKILYLHAWQLFIGKLPQQHTRNTH